MFCVPFLCSPIIDFNCFSWSVSLEHGSVKAGTAENSRLGYKEGVHTFWLRDFIDMIFSRSSIIHLPTCIQGYVGR